MRWVGMLTVVAITGLASLASAGQTRTTGRQPAGVQVIKIDPIRAYPSRPQAAIDIQRRAVSSPLARLDRHFVGRVPEPLYREPF